MFDVVKNEIKNGDYASAIFSAYIISHIPRIELSRLSTVSGYSESEMNIPPEKKKIYEKLYKQEIETTKKLLDLLVKTYHIKDGNKDLLIDEILRDPYNTYFTNIINTKRDNEIIKIIEKFEGEFLNADGWDYNERISEKFKTLVDECKTKDADYINQLSNLLQAMEDNYYPILLVGESGVGKSRLAKTFHSLSNRNEKGFAEMNCGSFASEDRLNQNLFGWEKGSHSTASETKKGKIDEANGGILFLDEVDRLPKGTRDALITFIETKKFQRLGSEKDTEADVVILVGTNKNLKKLVAEGLLEEDFYYRISNYMINIPPLRERKGDIDLITEYCLARYNENFSTNIMITSEAMDLLKTYPWYGNFRVLEGYLKKILQKCKWKNEKFLTPFLINIYPPDILSPEMTENYEKIFNDLEKVLEEMFFYWYNSVYPKQTQELNKDNSNEKNKDGFLQQMVNPILANIYDKLDLKYFGRNQKTKNSKAREIIGIGGQSSGKEKSILSKYLDTYNDLKKD